jgi:soluble lytic murein transglycosylase
MSFSLDASSLNLDFFNDKPKSLTKDFYISQFLDQGVSDKEAEILLPQVKNLNPKLFKKFAKHIDAFKRKAYCQSLNKEAFLGKSHECVAIGLTFYKATKLPPSLLKKIALQVSPNNPSLAAQYLAISTKKFDNLIKLPPKLLLQTFNSVGGKFRKAYYNHPLPPTLTPLLTKEKAFNTTIQKIVRGDFEPLQRSLIELNATNLNAESNFLLALNAIRYQREDKALLFLQTSQKKAAFTFEKDKALFWQYLLTKDRHLLTTLTKSHEINLYSLYAYEHLGAFPTNIITHIRPQKSGKPIFDISDPFAWLKFQKRVKAMQFQNYDQKRRWVMQYNTPQLEPHISRLLYRFKNNVHFYLTPYSQYLQDLPIERKILILALARQESHFIPSEVSYSYALGMMQFMPFVAKDIAKKEGIKNFQYEEMFKPQVAYQFANIHLDFLEKSVKHPLFIAYAYNAGLGFTKRKILSKNYFKKAKYEPFWSLEMVPNAQARKYGKRVLANYAVYAKILGFPLTLTNLLESIK